MGEWRRVVCIGAIIGKHNRSHKFSRQLTTPNLQGDRFRPPLQTEEAVARLSRRARRVGPDDRYEPSLTVVLLPG